MRAAAREQRTPLWSDDTGAVVSRLVAPIGAGEGNARYYADLLQVHLGTVAAGLQAAGVWPANLPLLQHRSVISLPEGGAISPAGSFDCASWLGKLATHSDAR